MIDTKKVKQLTNYILNKPEGKEIVSQILQLKHINIGLDTSQPIEDCLDKIIHTLYRENEWWGSRRTFYTMLTASDKYLPQEHIDVLYPRVLSRLFLIIKVDNLIDKYFTNLELSMVSPHNYTHTFNLKVSPFRDNIFISPIYKTCILVKNTSGSFYDVPCLIEFSEEEYESMVDQPGVDFTSLPISITSYHVNTTGKLSDLEDVLVKHLQSLMEH